MSFKRDSKGRFSFDGTKENGNNQGGSAKRWFKQLGFGGSAQDASETHSVGDDASSVVSSSFKSNMSDDEQTFDEPLDPDAGSVTIVAHHVNKFVKRQAKAFVKNFIDYGPPYKDKGPFDPILINECARPAINHRDIHKFLNMRMNPNRPDPEDLYYTPVHWVGRNAHLLALRMLRRAGAKLNITNEMGHTPLDLCVMIKHPPDKRKEQLKMAIYMLENGADPNSRDKGGFSAIDHAAANQDAEMVAVLLEFGANVLRKNHTFVAPRESILKEVHDPECYRLLYEQLLVEEGAAERRRLERERQAADAQLDKRHVKLHIALDKRKEKRQQREQQRAAAALRGAVMSDRAQQLHKEMERNLRARERSKASHGLWKPDSVGNWEFHARALPPVSSDLMYRSNLALMQSLFEENKRDKYNKRWQKITAGADIETSWQRADPFAISLPKISRGSGQQLLGAQRRSGKLRRSASSSGNQQQQSQLGVVISSSGNTGGSGARGVNTTAGARNRSLLDSCDDSELNDESSYGDFEADDFTLPPIGDANTASVTVGGVNFALAGTTLEDIESLCSVDSVGASFGGAGGGRYASDEAIRRRGASKVVAAASSTSGSSGGNSGRGNKIPALLRLNPEYRDAYDRYAEDEEDLDDLIDEMARVSPFKEPLGP